jgi:hypothetical protein
MVKITNSTFHNIFGMGLFVASVEPSEEGGSAGILLDHVTSSNNGLSEPEGLGCGYSYDPAYGNGLFVIENMGSLTIKNSHFDCNYGMGPFGFGGSGITVEGQFGPVNISNTSASDNLGIGVAINGFGGVGAPRVGAFQPIRQTINLDHVLANENGLIGIAIGSSTYSSPRPNGSPVSYFSNINITNSQINDNGGFGGFSDFSPRIGSADISGPYGSGLVLEGPINAHVSNTSIQDNYSSGIYAWDADGSLVLCNVKFGGNDEDLSYDPAYLNVSYCHPGTAAELGGGGILIIPIDYSGDLTKSPSKPNTGLSNGITTMVFEVIETKDTGEKVLWGQATLPGGAAPSGSTGSITQKDQASLPGALPADDTYVGITFTLNFVDASGTGLNSLGEAMQVKIKLPDGDTVPAGKKLQIQVWDTSSSKWVGLDTIVVDGFAYANTTKLGTFTLALIPAP